MNQQMYGELLIKNGNSNDYLYENKTSGKGYRIYINTSEESDDLDIFLTDYIKMCISRKIPFNMKGHQGKGEDEKDNTVLYLKESNLLDYLQIVDDLSAMYPSIIASFGEPPLLTQKLKSHVPNVSSGWFGFSDLGQDGQGTYGGTYNDRTEVSCINAFISAFYSCALYESKEKLQNNGYDLKALRSMVDFKIRAEIRDGKYNRGVFLEELRPSSLKSPLNSEGKVKGKANKKIVKDILSICSNDIARIQQNPKKKQEMFDKFKNYYVLFENYLKYNGKDRINSKHCNRVSFEDYKELPTTVSFTLYEKYKEELLNRKNKKFTEQEIGKATISVPTYNKDLARDRVFQDENTRKAKDMSQLE